MDLSVVIVSWNVADLLRECLVSLAQQLQPGSYETVVVDNASADGSVAMLAGEFPTVRIVANPSNRGFAAAVNQGVAASTGRDVLLLNPDTRLLEDTYAAMRSVFDERADVGIAGPRLVDDAGHAARGAGGSFPAAVSILNTALGLHRIFPSARWSRGICLSRDERRGRDIDWVSGACMLVRREVFEAVGGMDEGYFLLCEDVDFCWRAFRAGWKTFYSADTTVVHHEGSSIGKQDDAFLAGHGGTLAAYLRARHGRVAAALILLPLKLNYAAKLGVFGASYLVRRTPSTRHRLLLVRKHLRILS